MYDVTLADSTLIVAYGNPLRGDDGVGWQAAILLARELKDQVQVLTRHQLTPELAETLSEASRVIFIDAAAQGPAGEVHCRAVERTGELAAQPFTHHVAPADLLTAAHTLYGHAPTGYLITVNGGSFGYTETLSPAVEAALPGVLTQVREIVGGPSL
ncbi:hydrogenase maturation protease [bacterium]|nr:hydrogenase maturation protease [bacterium]